MLEDLKKISEEEHPKKIITHQEWMTAAIYMLEAPLQEGENQPERSFKKFYEALFIDPSKLTPL